MAATPQYAWAMNQAGVKLPAEILRGQHYDATSGGTGVGSPRALKVLPQAAPDSTVMILPGGGTAVSTYAGHENQSYQATNFKPQTLEIPPTGSSSGGRTDLLIQRFLDPNMEPHPDHTGDYPIPAEIAKDLWYWRFECKPGMDRTAKLNYPHVKLSELNRPANTAIVNDSHITDLRELANPHQKVVPLIMNIGSATHTAGRTGNYNTLAEFHVDVPEWATTAVVDGTLAGCFVKHPNGGVTGNFDFDGLGSFVGGSQGDFQQTGWGASGSVAYERIDFHAGGEVVIDPERRGTTQRVRLRVRIPTTAPVESEAGTESQSLVKLNVTFKQGVL